MEPIFFDTQTPHPPGVFCRRLIAPSYFISYFETDFRYELDGILHNGKAGSILIMEPGALIYHGPAADSDLGFVNDWIYLKCEELPELLQKYPLPLNIPFSVGKENILRPFIETMRKEKSLCAPGYADYVYFLTGQLIVGLFRLCRSNLPGTETDRMLEQIRKAMRMDPQKPWTLTETAHQSGYSVSRFCYLYKEKFGCSPKQDLLSARIQLAAHMLNYTDSSITEIATACGFQSIQYFSKYFKAATGMTPKVYANNRK